MWRDHLAYDLLWAVEQPRFLENSQWTRPDSYTAPSWSWASVNCPVRFIYNPLAAGGFNSDDSANASVFRSPLQVIDVSVVSDHADGFGHVSSGALTIKAGLGLINTGVYHEKGTSRHDNLLIGSIDGVQFSNLKLEDATTRQDSRVVLDSLFEVMFQDKLYCVPIIIKSFFIAWEVNGIVIAPSKTSRGKYSRVGYIRADGIGTDGVKGFENLEEKQVTII